MINNTIAAQNHVYTPYLGIIIIILLCIALAQQCRVTGCITDE